MQGDCQVLGQFNLVFCSRFGRWSERVSKIWTVEGKISKVVAPPRLELGHPCERRILNPLRLPFRQEATK